MSFLRQHLSHNRSKRKRSPNPGIDTKCDTTSQERQDADKQEEEAPVISPRLPQHLTVARPPEEQTNACSSGNAYGHRQRQRRRRIAYYKKCHQEGLQSNGDDNESILEGSPALVHSRGEATVLTRDTRISSNRPTIRPSVGPPAWVTSDGWEECLPFLLLLLPSLARCGSILREHHPTIEEARAYARSVAQERKALAQEHALLKNRFYRFRKHVEAKNQEWQRQMASLKATSRPPLREETTQTSHSSLAIQEHAPACVARFSVPIEQSDSPTRGSKRNSNTVKAPYVSKENLSTSESNSIASQFGPQTPDPRGNLKTTGLEPQYLLHTMEWGHKSTLPASKKSRRVTASPARIPENVGGKEVPSDAIVPDQIAFHGSLHPPEDSFPDSETIVHHSMPSRDTPMDRTVTKPPGQADFQEHHTTDKGRQDGAHTNKHSLPQAKPRIADIPTSLHRQHVPNPFERRTLSVSNEKSFYEEDSQTIIPPPKPQTPAVSPFSADLGPPGRDNDFDGGETSIPSSAASKAAQSVEKATKAVSKLSKARKPSPSSSSGWISTRHAKAFVAEVAAHNIALAASRIKEPSSKAIAPTPEKGKSHADQTPRAKTQASPDSTEDPHEQPYTEVVRKKTERAKLKPHRCEECGAFMDAVLASDDRGVHSRDELMCCSRHRHRFTPPETPEGFWELSFHDEILARQKAQLEKEMDE